MQGKLAILAELWSFLRERKRLWLAPVLAILLLLGIILVLTESSIIAPLIYTLF